MKKYSVVVLVALSLVYAGFTEAATPKKKRTRNANRVGAYGGAQVGMTSFNSDQAVLEQQLIEYMENRGVAVATADTEDSDLGFQVIFGYRFNRFFAAEFGLAQYGELVSSASGEVTINGTPLPASVSLSFSVGGPVFCAVGILPINEKFEVYGRAGYLFASTEQEIDERLDGDRVRSGSGKGNSTELVLGLGATWHINQVYSIRGEFQKIDAVGEADRTGQEDLTSVALGVVIRF